MIETEPEDAPPLFLLSGRRHRAGRFELSLDNSIKVAGLDGHRYEAAVSAVRALAAALDAAESRGDLNATARLSRPFADALGRLGLMPDPDDGRTPPGADGKAGDDDPLDGMGQATLGDAPHA